MTQAVARISGETRRSELLDAAVRVFSEKGYDGASLQDIAEQVGILKGSVYYYYRSKEDILFDVVKAIHDEHLDDVRALAGGQGDALARLRRLLEGHAVFVCRNLERATVLVRELERLPPPRQAAILGPDHAYQRVFRDLIAEAQRSGRIAAEANPKLATLWILGALNWLHRWYRPDRSDGPERLAAQFADQLTRGLVASPLWTAISQEAPPSQGRQKRGARRSAGSGGSNARRRLPRSERRAEILQVATEVFYAKGYEAASLQDIAEAMGVKKASLYYYFASKDDLLQTLLPEIIGRGIANARAALAPGGDPLSRLWRLVAAHIRHLTENLADTAVFLHERNAIAPGRRREILADDYQYQALFFDTIQAGQAAGDIRGDLDPKLAALTVLGSANWTYAWFRPGGDLMAVEIGAQFAMLTVASLAEPTRLWSWRPPSTKGATS